MGCVITITDEPAIRASEKDLLALVPRGKAPAGAGEAAVARTKDQGSSSAVTHAGSCPSECTMLAAAPIPGGSGKGLAPSSV